MAIGQLTGLEMSEKSRRFQRPKLGWRIQEYHRGIKQFVGIERAQVGSSKGQRNHIRFLVLGAFLALERYRFRTGLRRFEAEIGLTRSAVHAYLENPCTS